MAALNLLDAASRSTTVAKKGWVKKAVPDSRKGVFKKKAEAAGLVWDEMQRRGAIAQGVGVTHRRGP